VVVRDSFESGFPREVDLAEIEVGDRIWESGQYGNAEIEVLTKPEQSFIEHFGRQWEQWRFEGRTSNGVRSFLTTIGFQSCLRFYSQPVYWGVPTHRLED
jgi:hypothetical protein